MSGGRIPAESVEREKPRPAGVVATMWAVREKGKNYPHTLPGIFRDEQEKYLRPCDELVKVTVEPVEGE